MSPDQWSPKGLTHPDTCWVTRNWDVKLFFFILTHRCTRHTHAHKNTFSCSHPMWKPEVNIRLLFSTLFEQNLSLNLETQGELGWREANQQDPLVSAPSLSTGVRGTQCHFWIFIRVLGFWARFLTLVQQACYTLSHHPPHPTPKSYLT